MLRAFTSQFDPNFCQLPGTRRTRVYKSSTCMYKYRSSERPHPLNPRNLIDTIQASKSHLVFTPISPLEKSRFAAMACSAPVSQPLACSTMALAALGRSWPLKFVTGAISHSAEPPQTCMSSIQHFTSNISHISCPLHVVDCAGATSKNYIQNLL